LKESIKHHLDQREPVVLAFGQLEGGHTCNVLPSKIILKGTLRYLNSALKETLHQVIDDTIRSVEQFTEAQIFWSIPHESPGLTNDDACTDLIIEAAKLALGSENVHMMKESSMGGEDFAYYLEEIPGAYFRIGCSDGKTRDIHTNDFDIDEKCMATAIKVFAETVKRYFILHHH
jgi:amidohydrolase